MAGYVGLFDATGKYPTGVLQASRVDLGAFDECIETEVRDIFGNVSSRGQYCNVQFQPKTGAIGPKEMESMSSVLHPKLLEYVGLFMDEETPLIRIGLCFLDNCNEADLQALVDTGMLLKLVVAFSAAASTRELFHVAERSSADHYSLRFLYGMRAISLGHIVLAHCHQVVSDSWSAPEDKVTSLALTCLPVFFVITCVFVLPRFVDGPDAKTFFQKFNEEIGDNWWHLIIQIRNFFGMTERVMNAVGWLVAASCAFCAVFMKIPWYRRPDPTSEGVKLFMAFLDRILWSLFLSWFTLACATGRGGLVNRVLSSGVYVPLGKLSFGVYLIHYPFLMVLLHTTRERLLWSHFTVVTLFFSVFVWSNVLGYMAFLACEAPTAAVDKLIFQTLLGRRRPAQKESQPDSGDVANGQKQIPPLWSKL
ncbi:hypothetical protein HPB52_006707 [Rhipicephalus sanguineus]|uniref:Nose resistant-to-fluoxetine protein N-terminal domain-containing protein n=1 Tax=Rhipicephalus sanguineus TaxID=34632 RepID=A0A9D4T8R3_RHISA|nr:hypothetical protein HPB52_006707 [Rhipicephalus sanguineus]